ncbi:peptide transporter [bacterium]|nr:MAG: peptide transporter [bacterium]
MMPGSIYLGLIAGQGMGPAAEWVTIILFMEIARRSYQTLRKQEIYLLYYVGSSLTQQVAGIAIAGGPFATLIWNSYVANTPIAQQLGISSGLANAPWAAVIGDSPGLVNRTFFSSDWLPAIGLLIFGQIFTRMTSWGLGYVLFRITSDVERLPFPLAPIAAEGATALAESSSQKEGWRWRIFSIGSMIGVGWGAMYILLPAVTGLIFAQPITILSVPFIDYTQNTQKILPAALTGLGTDLGNVFIGFLLPLPVVVGTFIASIGCFVVGNPILYHKGILTKWVSGTDMLQSQMANSIDFWLSFGIGTSIVVAVIGIFSVIRSLMKAKQQKEQGISSSLTPPKGRGDISIWISLGIFAIGTTGFIVMCHRLVPLFPLGFLIFFGFVWTPIFSYINARMAGLAGTNVSIPYVKEASFMLAGYRNVDIWFAPIPLADHGGMATHFRTVELTKTKFTSIMKVELMMLPIMLGCSLLFWSFIWKLSPIPAASYPFAAKFWPITAQSQALWFTANREGENNFLLQSINMNYIGFGAGSAILAYVGVILGGLPTLLFYGLINGTHTLPAYAIPQFIGGMLGRYYFQKRYGKENWRSYTPVLVAGFYCGMGLIGMAAVSLALLSKSVSRLPY